MPLVEKIQKLCFKFGSPADIVLDLLPFFTSDEDNLDESSAGAFFLSRIIHTISHGFGHCEGILKEAENLDDQISEFSFENIHDQNANDGQFSFGGKNENFDFSLFSDKALRKNIQDPKWLGSIGIATDLLLIFQELGNQDNAFERGLFAVSNVIHQSLNIVDRNDEKFKQTFHRIHKRYFVKDNLRNPPPQSKLEYESINPNSLLNILQSILISMMQSTEVISDIHNDFEDLWTTMCADHFSTFQDDEVSVKECIWTIKALVYLRSQNKKVQSQIRERRKSRLTVGALITLLAVEDDINDSNIIKKQKFSSGQSSPGDAIENTALVSLSLMKNQNQRGIPTSTHFSRISQKIQVTTAELLDEVQRVSDFIKNQLLIKFLETDPEQIECGDTDAAETLRKYVIDRDARYQTFTKMISIYNEVLMSIISSGNPHPEILSSITSIFSLTGINQLKINTLTNNPRLTTYKALSNSKSIVSASSMELSASTQTSRSTRNSLCASGGIDRNEVSSISVSFNSESENSYGQELAANTQYHDLLQSITLNLSGDTSNDVPLGLNDWITRLYDKPSLVKITDQLRLFMNQSDLNRTDEQNVFTNIVHILNHVMNRLHQKLCTHIDESEVNHQIYTIVSDSGELRLNDGIDKTVQKVLTSLLSLYYGSLEQILITETQRLQIISHHKLLSNDNFHRALLATCLECIVQVHQPNFTTESILDVMQIDGYELFKVMECFIRNMSRLSNNEALAFPELEFNPPLLLPQVVANFLLRRESEILESSLWMSCPEDDGGGVIRAIAALNAMQSEGRYPNAWPPPCLAHNIDIDDDDDEISNLPVSLSVTNTMKPIKCEHSLPVELIVRKTLILCARRILQLADKLEVNETHVHRIWIALRHFFRNHIYALYDHHIDHIILCSLYAICKITFGSPDLTFSRIIDVYLELNQKRGDSCNQKIIRHILIERVSDGSLVFGNIIQFYNKIFVPTMKPHLVRNSDVEYITKHKSKTNKVMSDILKTAKLSHWNTVSRSQRGKRFENVIVKNKEDCDDETVGIPRGRVFYHFGGGSGNSIQKIRVAINNSIGMQNHVDSASKLGSSHVFNNAENVTKVSV